MERLTKIRAALAVSKTAEAEVALEQQKAAEKAAEEDKEKKRMEGPPESSAEKIDRQKSADDARAQLRLRAQREIEDLRKVLQQERDALEAEKTALAAERKKFDETAGGDGEADQR